MAELTTITLIKSYVGMTGTADDTLLTALLESAEIYIRQICNRPNGWLNTSAHTEKIYGTRFDNLPLIYTPVTAITSVKFFTSSAVSTTLSSDYYRINDEANAVLLNAGGYPALWDSGYDVGVGDSIFPMGQTGYPTRTRAYPYVEVIYTGGHANQAAIPEDLEQAANEYVAWMFWARKEYKPEDHEKWGDIMRKRLQRHVRMEVV